MTSTDEKTLNYIKDQMAYQDPQIELNNILNHAIEEKKILVEASHIELMIGCIAQQQRQLNLLREDIKALTKQINIIEQYFD